jgi:hypothetical protein
MLQLQEEGSPMDLTFGNLTAIAKGNYSRPAS